MRQRGCSHLYSIEGFKPGVQSRMWCERRGQSNIDGECCTGPCSSISCCNDCDVCSSIAWRIKEATRTTEMVDTCTPITTCNIHCALHTNSKLGSNVLSLQCTVSAQILACMSALERPFKGLCDGTLLAVATEETTVLSQTSCGPGVLPRDEFLP